MKAATDCSSEWMGTPLASDDERYGPRRNKRDLRSLQFHRGGPTALSIRPTSRTGCRSVLPRCAISSPTPTRPLCPNVSIACAGRKPPEILRCRSRQLHRWRTKERVPGHLGRSHLHPHGQNPLVHWPASEEDAVHSTLAPRKAAFYIGSLGVLRYVGAVGRSAEEAAA